MLVLCEECGTMTANPENDYGEHICDSCLDNAAEREGMRQYEDFHDGGSVKFKPLIQLQIEAMKLK